MLRVSTITTFRYISLDLIIFMNTINTLTHTIENEAPVYFLDLTVENVRCFGDRQTLDLSDGKGKPARWTIILGDNGVGKTTLLKCLAPLEANPERKRENFQTAAKNLSIHLPLTETYELVEFSFNRSNDKPFIVLPTLYRGSLSSQKYDPISEHFLTQASASEIYLADYFIIYAYGASRRMGSGSLEKTYHPNGTMSLFREEVSLINAVGWLLNADYAIKSADTASKAYYENRYEKVKNMLIDLLPDVENIRAKPITKTQSHPAIEFQTPYGWVSLKKLSLGYQTLIAWMVDLGHRLFERYPDYDNPLEQPAIVLVDEIDLHLHPKWQRTVIEHLSRIFKQTQFIVTAHSPLIVQSAPEEANIVLLKREGDHVIIHNNEQLIKGWRIDQVLTSDLFDLPSARPAEYDNYLKRQAEILSKPQLTPADEQELEDIGKKLDELPLVTENPEDNEAMAILRKAADIFKTHYKI
ncbi:MAG: AAA family ATPase [Candidatus Parabeggiatoa sp.]|nr:AAA family ATPase [Candidatus Parabeggiatoa sp.]